MLVLGEKYIKRVVIAVFYKFKDFRKNIKVKKKTQTPRDEN